MAFSEPDYAMYQSPLSTSNVDEDKQSRPEIIRAGLAKAPDTAAPASGGASPRRDARSSHRKRNRLSCTNCQQKKVKCDRADPCSRCVRVGAICVSFPPSGAPRGREGGRRSVNHELLSRIAKLENLVKSIKERDTGEDSGEPTGGTEPVNDKRAV